MSLFHGRFNSLSVTPSDLRQQESSPQTGVRTATRSVSPRGSISQSPKLHQDVQSRRPTLTSGQIMTFFSNVQAVRHVISAPSPSLQNINSHFFLFFPPDFHWRRLLSNLFQPFWSLYWLLSHVGQFIWTRSLCCCWWDRIQKCQSKFHRHAHFLILHHSSG